MCVYTYMDSRERQEVCDKAKIGMFVYMYLKDNSDKGRVNVKISYSKLFSRSTKIK